MTKHIGTLMQLIHLKIFFPHKYCRHMCTSFKFCEHLVEEFQGSWVTQIPFVVLSATCNSETYVKVLYTGNFIVSILKSNSKAH